MTIACVSVFFISILAIAWWATRSGQRIVIRRVSVGVGPARREEAQRLLKDALKGRDPQKYHHRVDALRDAIRALRKVEDAWVYESVPRRLTLQPEVARTRFDAIATDLRSRFRYETRHAEAHVLQTTPGPDIAPRAPEGVGLCVVSLVVAYRRIDGDGEAKQRRLEHTLEAIERSGSGELIALEIIWSPSTEGDRMSSAELEECYPELTRREGVDSMGPVNCKSCRAIYARELGECPTCGAPG